MTAAHDGPTPYQQAAAHLVLAGWWPLPLPYREKTPPPDGFTGHDGRDPTPAEISAWLAAPDPRRVGNVGVRIPPDVVGIDVDGYDDKPGAATLAQLEAKLGPLPPTVIITSRSDGVSGIRLFRLPDGVDQSTFRTGWPGIELCRYGHRYVVAPPSIHPKTGSAYRCFDPATGEVLATLPPKADLPVLPEAWAAACAKPQRPERTTRLAPAGLPVAPGTPDPYAPCKAMSNALAGILEQLRGGSSRHDAATAGAMRLARLAERGHCGVEYALDVVARTFIPEIQDRISYAGAVAEWQSIVDTAKAKVDADQWPAGDRGCCGPDSAAARSQAAADRWLAELEHATPRTTGAEDAGGTSADEPAPVTDLEDRIAEAKRLFVEERLPVIDWHALWDDDSEEEWIVEPILPARRLVALYSAPKVGKSLLLLEIAAAIAKGSGWVLDSHLDQARTVLYVDFENDPRADVRERLINMGYGPDDLGRLRYLSFPTLAALDSERGAEELMAAVEHHRAEVVVIDTVSRAVAGEENENDTWLAFYRHTGLRLKQAGVAMIRLDHAGKDETKGQRGGSAKVGDVDAVWRLSRVTDTVYRLQCEANRMPLAPEQKDLTLNRVEEPTLRHTVAANGWKARQDADLAAADAALAGARVPDDVLTQRRLGDWCKAQGITLTRAQMRAWLDAEKRRRGMVEAAS